MTKEQIYQIFEEYGISSECANDKNDRSWTVSRLRRILTENVFGRFLKKLKTKEVAYDFKQV